MPRESWDSSWLSILPSFNDPIGSIYSKLVLAPSDLMKSSLEDQKKMLEELMAENHSFGEIEAIPFIEKCIENLTVILTLPFSPSSLSLSLWVFMPFAT